MKTVKLSDKQWGILVELLVEQRNELNDMVAEEACDEDRESLSEQLYDVRNVLAAMMCEDES